MWTDFFYRACIKNSLWFVFKLENSFNFIENLLNQIHFYKENYESLVKKMLIYNMGIYMYIHYMKRQSDSVRTGPFNHI